MSTHASNLRVFALWQYDSLQDAIARFHDEFGWTKPSRPVAFARLADGDLVPDDVRRDLRRQGIQVVPVSARFAHCGEGAVELLETVDKRLHHRIRLQSREVATQAPAIDEQAARAVSRAYAGQPSSSSVQHQEFLKDFYGSEDEDDGIRG